MWTAGLPRHSRFLLIFTYLSSRPSQGLHFGSSSLSVCLSPFPHSLVLPLYCIFNLSRRPYFHRHVDLNHPLATQLHARVSFIPFVFFFPHDLSLPPKLAGVGFLALEGPNCREVVEKSRWLLFFPGVADVWCVFSCSLLFVLFASDCLAAL